jgi:hypothetical protein
MITLNGLVFVAVSRIISDMNSIGLICAITTFLNVWLGHVAVRHIEARVVSIKLPAALCAVAGLGLLSAALASTSLPVSAGLGITGVLVLWDGFEFVRQERRVIKGHAPANPANPRHRRILAGHPTASTVQWLKREPLGRPLTATELEALCEAAK